MKISHSIGVSKCEADLLSGKRDGFATNKAYYIDNKGFINNTVAHALACGGELQFAVQ
jgi:hypothetical protein